MSQQPVAGWYPDPQTYSNLRFWDGTKWTDQTRETPHNEADDIHLGPDPHMAAALDQSGGGNWVSAPGELQPPPPARSSMFSSGNFGFSSRRGRTSWTALGITVAIILFKMFASYYFWH